MKKVRITKSERDVIMQRMRRQNDPDYRDHYNTMRREYYARERTRLNAARQERKKEKK